MKTTLCEQCWVQYCDTLCRKRCYLDVNPPRYVSSSTLRPLYYRVLGRGYFKVTPTMHIWVFPYGASQAGTISMKPSWKAKPIPQYMHTQPSTARSLPAVPAAVLVFCECCVYTVLPRCANTSEDKPSPQTVCNSQMHTSLARYE